MGLLMFTLVAAMVGSVLLYDAWVHRQINADRAFLGLVFGVGLLGGALLLVFNI